MQTIALALQSSGSRLPTATRVKAAWWPLVGYLLTNKNMSGGVKLGYIEATTNKLAMLILAMGLEKGTEQSEHVNIGPPCKLQNDVQIIFSQFMNLYWLAILYLQDFEITNSSVGFRKLTSPMSNRNCFAPRSVCHSGVGRLRDIMSLLFLP